METARRVLSGSEGQQAGKERRFADELGGVLEFVEELKAEERPLVVVMLNGLQNVGVGVGRERGLRANHGAERFETASSISRRTSDHGRAADGLAR
jgi:hypothetical protein